MNELVKYNNDMNKIHFTGFSKTHMDLFLAICSKVKGCGNDTIFITSKELKAITHFEKGGKHDFFKELHSMVMKLHSINGSIIDISQGKGNRTFETFRLFDKFKYSEKTGLLEVRIEESFMWLLNEFETYTIFELAEFVELNSKYSKHLYRILKQWRTTGKYIFHDLNEFRELMDVPPKYTNRQLMQDCVSVAVEEIKKLDKSFKNFKCKPEYAQKRGKPLDKLMFTWTPEVVPTQHKEEKQSPEQLQGQESFSDCQSFDEYMKHYQGDDKPSPVAIKIARDIEKGNKKKQAEPKKNKFINFEQRTYDEDELEALLLTTNVPE